MLVIFDIDGTLNMTETYGIEAYHEALGKMDADHFSDAQLKERIGATFTEDVRYFFGDDAKEKMDEFSSLIRKLWFAKINKKATLFPGVLDMLHVLRKKGHQLAICSNADESEITIILKALHIEHEFDFVQGLTECDNKSDSLRVLLQYALPDRAVMVADRIYDMQAAEINHIPFIGCLYGYGNLHELDGAQYRVTEASLIPEIVDMLNVQ